MARYYAKEIGSAVY